jgi:hypothetical protein
MMAVSLPGVRDVLAAVLEVTLLVTALEVELLVDVLVEVLAVPVPPPTRKYPPIPATTKAATRTTAAAVVEIPVLDRRTSVQPVTTIVPVTGTMQAEQWYG